MQVDGHSVSKHTHGVINYSVEYCPHLVTRSTSSGGLQASADATQYPCVMPHTAAQCTGPQEGAAPRAVSPPAPASTVHVSADACEGTDLDTSQHAITTAPTSYAAVFYAGSKPPKKKRQKSLTGVCARCRESKVRCGAERPCARCIKHGLQDSCVTWLKEAKSTAAERLPSDDTSMVEASLNQQASSSSDSGLKTDSVATPDSRPDLSPSSLPAGAQETELHQNAALQSESMLDSDTFVSVLHDEGAWDHLPPPRVFGGWISACALIAKPGYEIACEDDMLDGDIIDSFLPPSLELE